ncbi:MAG: hypothetical protein ACRC9R_07750 [Enterovibrio sp.]
MKNITLLFLVIFSSTCFAAKKSSSGDVYVPAYTKSNGTRVSGHYRSGPTSTQRDNWSTQGNTNPHTGKAGTKKAYK